MKKISLLIISLGMSLTACTSFSYLRMQDPKFLSTGHESLGEKPKKVVVYCQTSGIEDTHKFCYSIKEIIANTEAYEVLEPEDLKEENHKDYDFELRVMGRAVIAKTPSVWAWVFYIASATVVPLEYESMNEIKILGRARGQHEYMVRNMKFFARTQHSVSFVFTNIISALSGKNSTDSQKLIASDFHHVIDRSLRDLRLREGAN